MKPYLSMYCTDKKEKEAIKKFHKKKGHPVTSAYLRSLILKDGYDPTKDSKNDSAVQQ